MTTVSRVACTLCVLVVCGCPLWGQVQPVPIPGGDVIQSFGLFNQFLPGVGSIYDGMDAEPHGITK